MFTLPFVDKGVGIKISKGGPTGKNNRKLAKNTEKLHYLASFRRGGGTTEKRPKDRKPAKKAEK